ncbi:NAD-dependent epimerase/dehydratase family protein [Desulfotalea psychrophila]|uniref:Related to NAD(P)H steroid dehydrogenase n=1 Tax=Desulfotalea psychrophila (strain LSv54 / DSM 12343) TaxID=177439 RepID=Q6AJW7_DESPS|nr:NAD-dependent epimerase/dehydratase family protein [Desulfotalea psychrophila]CAG37359.1 related to NAD(P)H steroid dehydrogenase [Desulfotalea psychrophila LSv54]
MGQSRVVTGKIERALVTGGNGFVGRAIVQMLLADGVQVRVVGRGLYPQLEAMGVECYRGDIGDQAFMVGAVEGMDVVFHVAALAGIWGEWDDYYKTNVLGTQSVIAACLGRVRALVYTSTPSVVFNRQSIANGDESLPYPEKFLCHYAKSKVMAEKSVLAVDPSRLACVALRPHLVWGPGDPHLIPRLVASRLQNRLKIVGKKDNIVDVSYVDNVAHAHLLAANNLLRAGTAAGRAYFISQGQPVNLWDWLNELFVRLDVPPLERSVPFSLAYALGAFFEGAYRVLGLQNDPPMTRFVAEQLAKSHYFSIENAQKDFGYAPIVSMEEGIICLVASFKKD